MSWSHNHCFYFWVTEYQIFSQTDPRKRHNKPLNIYWVSPKKQLTRKFSMPINNPKWPPDWSAKYWWVRNLRYFLLRHHPQYGWSAVSRWILRDFFLRDYRQCDCSAVSRRMARVMVYASLSEWSHKPGALDCEIACTHNMNSQICFCSLGKDGIL